MSTKTIAVSNGRCLRPGLEVYTPATGSTSPPRKKKPDKEGCGQPPNSVSNFWRAQKTRIFPISLIYLPWRSLAPLRTKDDWGFQSAWVIQEATYFHIQISTDNVTPPICLNPERFSWFCLHYMAISYNLRSSYFSKNGGHALNQEEELQPSERCL